MGRMAGGLSGHHRLVEDLALGRDFDFRNTRDANGPIFPVGDVDPRLPVHEDVIGIVTDSGTPVAFQRTTAMARFWRARRSWSKTCDLSSTPAVCGRWTDGTDLGSHQAFWFAWSQFHPDTDSLAALSGESRNEPRPCPARVHLARALNFRATERRDAGNDGVPAPETPIRRKSLTPAVTGADAFSVQSI
jgi:hypothetical protein